MITRKVPAVKAFRGAASDILQRDGIANWALSMGRQRLGLLHLNNHGSFLQNLPMPHLQSASQTLDIAALDIIRDRERGAKIPIEQAVKMQTSETAALYGLEDRGTIEAGKLADLNLIDVDNLRLETRFFLLLKAPRFGGQRARRPGGGQGQGQNRNFQFQFIGFFHIIACRHTCCRSIMVRSPFFPFRSAYIISFKNGTTYVRG